MKHYLYRKACGRPDLKDYPLDLALFPDYALVWSGDNPPPVSGMIFDAANVLVPDLAEPEYVTARRKAYPPTAELADAIYWQARGDDTRMAEYLAKCDAVKARIVKPEAAAGN